MRRLLGLSTLALLGLLVSSSVATPRPPFLDQWRLMYPGSLSDDNFIAAGGTGCQICHQNTFGFQPWNPYGWEVRTNLLATGDIALAIAMAENLDSDMDPTGSTNIEEIQADTQPGWTDGPNNTLFWIGSGPVPGWNPPAAAGSYDPHSSIGTSYCSPAVANSTGIPATITADGSLSAGANDLTLTADDLPPQQFGYFLASLSQGAFTPPGSSGVLCLANDIGRFSQPSQIVQGPTGTLQVDLTSVPVNPPAAVQPGEVWNFQCWYRDVGNTSNFTDAVSIAFQ